MVRERICNSSAVDVDWGGTRGEIARAAGLGE
jgi:hypothetical protein